MLRHIHVILIMTTVLLSSCQGTQAGANKTATTASLGQLPTATTVVLVEPQTSVPAVTEPAPKADRLAPPPTPTAIATISPAAEPPFPTYDGPPLNRYDLGVQVHIHREDMSLIFNHLRVLEVGWVKAQVSWALYQPEPDQYSAERFAELDQLVSMAADQGIAVLLSVSKAPVWSRPVAEMNGPPENYELFRDFMRFLANRYLGRVGAYELWNEPNLQREWNGAALSASDFVELMEMGAAGVRAGDPDAIIVSGAPAPTGIDDGIHAIEDRSYFRDMLLAGAAEFVDFVGVHPYGWANPPDSSALRPDPSIPSHNDHPSFFFQDTLFDYRSILAELGLDKQLWATELGWGSFDSIGSPPPGAEFMAAVSEWQQALYTLRALELAHEWDWVGPMILWNLNFGPLLGTAYSESGYSLLGPDGAPRPVYRAIEAVPKKSD